MKFVKFSNLFYLEHQRASKSETTVLCKLQSDHFYALRLPVKSVLHCLMQQ